MSRFSFGSVWLLRHAEVLITSTLALATIIHLTIPLLRLNLLVSHNYNEGWNAYHALAVLNGKTLYPDPSDLITNNYPPLSFYLIAALGYVLGDNIFAGRIVAFLSFLFVSTCIAFITKQYSVRTSLALFSGLLFASLASARFRNYMAMDDPQWLGHAFSVAGLLLLLRTRVFAASLLMFLGGMIKHLLVPLPLSVTLWLFYFDRSRFYVWMLTGSVLFVFSMAFCYLAYGENFFLDVFSPGRVYSVHTLLPNALALALFFFPLLPVPIILLSIRGNPKVMLLLTYLATAAIWCVIIEAGAGANVNALFDVAIGLSIGSGVAIEALSRRLKFLNPSTTAALAMCVLALSALYETPGISKMTWHYLQEFKGEAHTSESDIRYLAEFEGPEICETLALCYWAGKNFEVDFFNSGQKLRTGTMSADQLLGDIENKRFSVIQMDGLHGGPGTFRLPEEIVKKILENYWVERKSDVNGFFLRPSE